MLNIPLLANPILSLFLMASEASDSFFAPSAPAPATSPPVRSMERHDGYSLYIPATAAPRGAPMVVMLHGASQDREDFALGTAMNSVAERHGFIVLYPAQSHSANAHRCWNWFDPAHQTRDQGDPARLAALTLQVARERQADPRRIYVAGLSAGGAMAALLGELFPEIYAAVGVHSGLAPRAGADLSSALAAMRGVSRIAGVPSGVPTIVFHGDKDSTVSPINAMRVIEASLGADCAHDACQGTSADGRRFTRRIYYRKDSSVCGELWQLHDASHAWSGGNRKGSYADPTGPNASEEMLRFFKNQRLVARRVHPEARLAMQPRHIAREAQALSDAIQAAKAAHSANTASASSREAASSRLGAMPTEASLSPEIIGRTSRWRLMST